MIESNEQITQSRTNIMREKERQSAQDKGWRVFKLLSNVIFIQIALN